MLGITMADDVASLQLASVIAEVVAVAIILTLSVRVDALALLRRQLAYLVVAWACARASLLYNCSACVLYCRPIEETARVNAQVAWHERLGAP